MVIWFLWFGCFLWFGWGVFACFAFFCMLRIFLYVLRCVFLGGGLFSFLLVWWGLGWHLGFGCLFEGVELLVGFDGFFALP